MGRMRKIDQRQNRKCDIFGENNTCRNKNISKQSIRKSCFSEEKY